MNKDVEENPKTNKTISISGTVLVWSIICTLLTAVVCAAVLLAVATNAIHTERQALLRATDAEQRLGECTLDKARLNGRVQSFEAMFVNPQKTAIEASLQEFNRIGGSDATIKEYQTWLSKNK